MNKKVDRTRRYKVFDNFYMNKDETIKEHKSARGGDLYITTIHCGIYRRDGRPLNIPQNISGWDKHLPPVYTEKKFRKMRKDKIAKPFRYWMVWKPIFKRVKVEELDLLIYNYKKEMRGLETKGNKDHQWYIKEMRTGITMGGHYKDVLEHIRDIDSDRYAIYEPPYNCLEQTDEEIDEEETERAEDEELSDEEKKELTDKEGSAIEQPYIKAENVKSPRKGVGGGIEKKRERFDPEVQGYWEWGQDNKAKVTGEGIELVDYNVQKELDRFEFRWYHRHYQQRRLDMLDIIDKQLENRCEELKSRPFREGNYINWRRGYNGKKKGKRKD